MLQTCISVHIETSRGREHTIGGIKENLCNLQKEERRRETRKHGEHVLSGSGTKVCSLSCVGGCFRTVGASGLTETIDNKCLYTCKYMYTHSLIGNF